MPKSKGLSSADARIAAELCSGKRIAVPGPFTYDPRDLADEMAELLRDIVATNIGRPKIRERAAAIVSRMDPEE